MKINEYQRISSLQTYLQNGTPVRREGEKKKQPLDQVQISQEAQQLAREAASQVPVRPGAAKAEQGTVPSSRLEEQSLSGSSSPERLAALKQAIQSGTYQVDARRVAEKLIAYWLGR